MINKEEFIEKSRKIHGDKYDYSKVEYKKVTDKVCIICPEHGEFWQEARQHYRGQGCPKCSVEKRSEKRKDTTETFIKKAKEIYGDKYDYSKVNYIDSLKNVTIICPQHGEFQKRADGFLQGHGCPKCGRERCGEKLSLTTESFIEKSKETHGDKYDYSKVNYIGQNEKVCIICPEHGEFWQNPYSHYIGNGCPKCGIEKRAKSQTKTTKQFIEKAIKVHGCYYDYSKTKYVNAHDLVTIICPEHGEFQQSPYIHLDGCGCQKCGMIKSHYEDELYEYIKSLTDVKIIRDDRSVLKDLKQSLDIYIPEKHVAFEFDGLYWHNELNKPNSKYHLNKTEKCLENGICLIHVFEDEWVYKKDIVKSRIKNILGLTDVRIFARKCVINEITNNEAKMFCEKNHLQGSVNGKISIGLYYNDELVSVMTFGKLRKNLGSCSKDGEYELLRFCNKLGITVVGGASKLFQYFIKKYNPGRVISYADRRWSTGNMYEKLGFMMDHVSQPNYFYVFGDTKKNRFNFRKNILIEKYDCPKEMSEHEFCLSQKWYRIYDCGCLCFEWRK